MKMKASVCFLLLYSTVLVHAKPIYRINSGKKDTGYEGPSTNHQYIKGKPTESDEDTDSLDEEATRSQDSSIGDQSNIVSVLKKTASAKDIKGKLSKTSSTTDSLGRGQGDLFSGLINGVNSFVNGIKDTLFKSSSTTESSKGGQGGPFSGFKNAMSSFVNDIKDTLFKTSSTTESLEGGDEDPFSGLKNLLGFSVKDNKKTLFKTSSTTESSEGGDEDPFSGLKNLLGFSVKDNKKTLFKTSSTTEFSEGGHEGPFSGLKNSSGSSVKDIKKTLFKTSSTAESSKRHESPFSGLNNLLDSFVSDITNSLFKTSSTTDTSEGGHEGPFSEGSKTEVEGQSSANGLEHKASGYSPIDRFLKGGSATEDLESDTRHDTSQEEMQNEPFGNTGKVTSQGWGIIRKRRSFSNMVEGVMDGMREKISSLGQNLMKGMEKTGDAVKNLALSLFNRKN